MNDNEQMLGIAIYRVSTTAQKDKSAIGNDFDGKSGGFDRQKTDVKNLCKQHNIKLVDEIQLVESGSQVQFTTEYEKLFNKLKDVDCVVVNDQDRYVRATDFGSMTLLQTLKDNNVKIISPSGISDLNTDMGFFVSGIQALLGGLELSKIRARMMGGKKRIKDAGGNAGGDIILPTGLRYYRASRNSGDKSYFYYDKVMMPKILKMFNMIESNKTYRQISQMIGLSRNTIPNLATNPCWIGLRRYDNIRVGKFVRTKTGKKYKRKQKLEIPQLVPLAGLEKPLITKVRFDNICKIVSEKKARELKSRDYSKNFLYTGTAICGRCGRQLYAKQRSNKPAIYRNKKTGKKRTLIRNKDYYQCSSGLYAWRVKKAGQGESVEKCGAKWQEKEKLEKVINSFVEEALTSWEFYGTLKKVVYENAPNTNYDLNEINAININSINKRIKDIEQDYMNGDILAKEFNKFKDKLTKDKETIFNENKKAIKSVKQDNGMEKLYEFAQLEVILKCISLFNAEDKKNIIKMIFSYIKVENYAITEFGLNPFNPNLITALKVIYKKTLENDNTPLTTEQERDLKLLIEDPNKLAMEYVVLALAGIKDPKNKVIIEKFGMTEGNPAQAAGVKPRGRSG
jgi:DNA invertase Pin-like site-specific DNA recombinase